MSISARCSCGVITTLRSHGLVAPDGLLFLDDLAVSKCMGTSVIGTPASVHCKPPGPQVR